MADSLITALIVPVLLALSYHTTVTSALECYGCFELDISTSASYPHCDKPIVVGPKKTHEDLDSLSALLTLDLLKSDPTLKMREGEFCLETYEEVEGVPIMFRNLVAEAPEQSFLDEFGCYSKDGEHTCYCQEDRCNLNVIDYVPSEKVEED